MEEMNVDPVTLETFDPIQYQLKRAKELYALVQGERPAWEKIPQALKERWLAALQTQPSEEHVRRDGPLMFGWNGRDAAAAPTPDRGYLLNGNEVDLARNRELMISLRRSGHNPSTVKATITWFDETTSTEDVVTDKCKPIPTMDHEMFGNPDDYCWKCASVIQDEGNANIFTDVGELVDRITHLEARVASLEGDNGGDYIREPLLPRIPTRVMRSVPPLKIPNVEDIEPVPGMPWSLEDEPVTVGSAMMIVGTASDGELDALEQAIAQVRKNRTESKKPPRKKKTKPSKRKR